MNMPMKISIVIPVYNSARFIGKALDAVMSLDKGNHEVEIIVVDDGSTDESCRIIEEYPVHLIRQPNMGPACARNTGWRKASGEIIFFTDADCMPEKDWIQCMAPPFQQPEVGAVAGSYNIANPENSLARLIQAEIIHRHKCFSEYARAGGSYNLAVRRDLLEALGGFDESYPTASGEDNDLSYRIQKADFRIAFNAESRVAHFHPERLGKYLKTQFVHGYWRGVLYRNHPEFITGDDYTRPRDILGSFLATIFLALCPFVFFSPFLLSIGLAATLSALVAMEGLCAVELAINNRDWILMPLGTVTFSVRSFYRVAGWFWGLFSSFCRGRELLRGAKR